MSDFDGVRCLIFRGDTKDGGVSGEGGLIWGMTMSNVILIESCNKLSHYAL